MAKFAVYEVAFEKICNLSGKKPAELTGTTKTVYNLSAGLMAGLAAAAVRLLSLDVLLLLSILSFDS
jgi:hypothetical protein